MVAVDACTEFFSEKPYASWRRAVSYPAGRCASFCIAGIDHVRYQVMSEVQCGFDNPEGR